MPDREEDIMTRILSIALATLLLTAIAAPSAEAARRHHRSTRHHARHAMHHARSGRGHMMATRSSAPSGDTTTDQLNQQSLNQARGQ